VDRSEFRPIVADIVNWLSRNDFTDEKFQRIASERFAPVALAWGLGDKDSVVIAKKLLHMRQNGMDADTMIEEVLKCQLS